RLDLALRSICQGTVSATFKNRKPVEESLADEILTAAKGDMQSSAIAKKEELERVASSARWFAALFTEGLISFGLVRVRTQIFLHRCHVDGTQRREHQEGPGPTSPEGPHPQHRHRGTHRSWKMFKW